MVGTALYQQTQLVAPNEVRTVESAADLRAVLSEYSSIDHVSLFMHMVNDDLLFRYEQLTLAQTQKVLDGSVPPIVRWSFDGCSIGRGSEALYSFAEHFGIARIEGWTHFHLIQPWIKTCLGNSIRGRHRESPHGGGARGQLPPQGRRGSQLHVE